VTKLLLIFLFGVMANALASPSEPPLLIDSAPTALDANN
jgi:hypothetical protein